MKHSKKTAARGRPPTITRERIAEAGIEMGLPDVTFVGLAARLGVSHMALYKHVPSLKVLKELIAEEIFVRWQIPEVRGNGQTDLKGHLHQLVDSLRNLVEANPGLPPYLLRRSVATPSITAKITEHQRWVASIYGMPEEQARWLLATVAFHCVAVADTVYTGAREETGTETGYWADEEEVEKEFSQGMEALIVGALSILKLKEPRNSQTDDPGQGPGSP